MGHRSLFVVALVFMAVYGAFAAHSSPTPPTPKASSPSKSPSSASPTLSSPKSDGGAPPISSPEGKVVSSPPLMAIANELFGSLSRSPNAKDIVIDGENVGYGGDIPTPTPIPTPAPSNVDVVKATGVVNVAIIVGLFLF